MEFSWNSHGLSISPGEAHSSTVPLASNFFAPVDPSSNIFRHKVLGKSFEISHDSHGNLSLRIVFFDYDRSGSLSVAPPVARGPEV